MDQDAGTGRSEISNEGTDLATDVCLEDLSLASATTLEHRRDMMLPPALVVVAYHGYHPR